MYSVNASKSCASLMTEKKILIFFQPFSIFTDFSSDTDFRIAAIIALVRKAMCLPKFQEEHLCLDLAFKNKGYPCQ